MIVDALERMQVDDNIDQGVDVGDGRTVAQMGTLDAQRKRLAVDALGGSALVVDLSELLAGAVKLIAKPRAHARGEGGETAALGPVDVGKRARLVGSFREEQRTGIAADLMRNETKALLEKG